MNSILRVRETAFSPVAETLNVAARGYREAETIAGWYAEQFGYGYWEVKFNDHATNAPRLIRNKNQIRTV